MNPIITCPRCGAELIEPDETGLCLRCSRAGSSEREPKPRFRTATIGLAAAAAAGLGDSGESTFGDYTSLERVDRGGMGWVYRAWHRTHGRMVALKVLVDGADAPEELQERFRAEIKALGALDHPNIIPLYEAGEIDGTPFYSMKLIEGESLSARLAREPGPRPSLEAAVWIMKIARAVHHAHQRGVLHRDLKPGNILLEAPASEPHLIDFGVAKLEFSDLELTRSESLLGTVPYMSPEQAAGKARSVTVASDVWALGVILYELLTGRLPFRGNTREETLQQILYVEPPDLAALNPQIDRDLQIICRRCLIKEPGGRYASAGAVADDLQRWIAHEPILARKVGGLERVARWCRRKPALAALGGVSIIALILGSVALVNWTISQRVESQRRLFHYVLDMNLAKRALDQGNLAQTRDYLASHASSTPEDLRGFEWRLLSALGRSQELRARTLGPGNPPVLSVAPVSATASTPGTASINIRSLEPQIFAALPGQLVAFREWDADLQSWPAPWQRTARLVVDGPGRRVFAASDAGCVVISLTGAPRVDLSRGLCNRIAWSAKSGRLAFGTMNDSSLARIVPLEVWEAPLSRRVATWPGVSPAALQWAPTSSGEELLVATRRGEILAWNPATSRFTTNWQSPTAIHQAAFSPDGGRVARIEESGRLVLGDRFGRGRLVLPNTYPVHATEIAFSSDGEQVMVTGGLDQRLHVFDARSGQERVTLQGHTGSVLAVADGLVADRVLTGSQDGSVRLWSLSAGARREPLRFSHNVASLQPQAPTFSADGSRLAMTLDMSGTNRQILVWSLAQERAIRHLAGLPVAFAPSGDGLMVWRSPEVVDVSFNQDPPPRSDLGTSTQTGSRSIRFPTKPSALEPQSSADGRRLFLLAQGYELAAYRAEDGTAIGSCPVPVDWFQPAPDGRGAIVVDRSGAVGWWDVAGATMKTLARDQRYDAIAISADGSMAAVSGWKGMVRLFRLPKGEPVLQYHADAGGVTALALAPDGRTLVIGSQEGFVRFLNLASQREVLTLALENAVGWLRFSPRGNALVAGTISHRNETNGTYYVWRVEGSNSGSENAAR